jgi:hypothetical protein
MGRFGAVEALSANLEAFLSLNSPDFRTGSQESYSSTCQAHADLSRKPKMFHASAIGKR